MQKRNPLFFLSIVMLVNALSYGTIIPLLYRYVQTYGMSAQMFAWMFASFSLAQFLATPIIGRLSDRYGRKPLLLISLFGTSVAMALFASAQSVFMLFFARILDGITGGNMSVAQAVISDVTEPKDRAKSFGILGAAFGTGFLLGPAIGGGFSLISLSAPFWFASSLALIGVGVGLVMLPETLKKKNVEKTALFKFKQLAQAVTLPSVGLVLLLTFFGGLGHTGYIVGFQSYTVDVLDLRGWQIGGLYSLIGLIGIIMQTVGLKWLIAKVGDEVRVFRWGMALGSLAFLLMILPTGFWGFLGLVILAAIGFSPLQPIVASLISKRTKPEDQGMIMGINQSYLSLAQIMGPIGAGAILSLSVHWVFLFPAMMYGGAYVIGKMIGRRNKVEIDL